MGIPNCARAFATMDAFGPKGQDDQGKVSCIVIPYLSEWLNVCMKMHS